MALRWGIPFLLLVSVLFLGGCSDTDTRPYISYEGSDANEIFYGESVNLALTSPAFAISNCQVANDAQTASLTEMGLSIGKNSCTIAGTPSQLSFPKSFSVIATDPNGTQYTTDITLSVIPKPSRYVYRFAEVSDRLSVAMVRPTSGKLVEIGTVLLEGGTQPTAIASEPTARFLFVADAGNTLNVYSINSATGALTHTSATATYAGPVKIAVDPTGRFLYGIHSQSSELSTYSIDNSTGALTSVGVTNFSGTPRDIVIHPNGRYLYTASSSVISSFAIQQTTGALSSIASDIAFAAGELEVHPTTKYLYAIPSGTNSARRYPISPIDGTLGTAVTFTMTNPSSALSFDPSGRFAYSLSEGNIDAYTFTQADGSLSALGSVTTSDCAPTSLGVDATGRHVYVPCMNTEGRTLVFSIDSEQGTLTQTSVSKTGSVAEGLAIVDANSRFVIAAANDRLFTYAINPTSGDLITLDTISTTSGTHEIALHPSGKFLFVINQDENTLATYSVDPASGQITLLGTPKSVGDTLSGLAVHPSGKTVYVVSRLGLKVYPFTFNQTTATLTALPDMDTGPAPKSIAIHPNGQFAYISNSGDNTISMYIVDEVTEELVAFSLPATASTGGDSDRIQIDPTGNFLYVAFPLSNSIGSLTIDNAGRLTPTTQNDLTLSGTAAGLSMDPTGRHLYASDTTNHTLHWLTIDRNDGSADPGALTSTSTSVVSNTPRATAIDHAGRYLYSAIGGTTSKILRTTIDRATEAFGSSATVDTAAAPVHLAVSR